MSQIMIDQALRSAIQHHQGGRISEAEAAYRQILTLQPNHAAAAHLLGVLAGQSGRLDMAVEWIGRAIKAAPNEASYHSNLGKFLMDKGSLEEAIAACRRAVELSPAFAEAHYNLANALHVSGRVEEAIDSYGQAIRTKPGLAAAHKNLGNALREKGRWEEAVLAYNEALRLNPGLAEVYGHLGVILRMQGRVDEAVVAFRRALGVKPDSADVLNNLGHTLHIQGKLDEAIVCYREALGLEPTLAEAHNNLGSALKDRGDLDGAVASYRTAIALQPDSAALHSNLLVALNYHVKSTRESLWQEAVEWGRRHAKPLANNIQAHSNNRDPDRILRVGYVSADFRQHASAFFLMPLLQHHDPRNVRIYCYADVDRPDAVTQQLQAYVSEWRSIAGLTDARVAQMIREDQIDVLVDLKLHTERNRLLVFARKPAPVQVTWLGYPGTTGLETMDYRLTDPHLDPTGIGEGCDAFYAEKSIRLPESFWCYDPLTPEPAVNSLPALANGYITFGCLNDLAKINPQTTSMWVKILQAVENSRLLLLAPEGSAIQAIVEEFKRAGVSSDRIELQARRPRAAYLELYQSVDITLDTWPCNGHTTNFDSLWMGVPVVTLVGPTVMGRAGVSQLMNLQLPELIAYGPEEYVQIAAALAADLPRLTALRAGLRERMLASPLMDGERFARNLEGCYRQMWQSWCSRGRAD